MDDLWKRDTIQLRRETEHWVEAIARMREIDVRCSPIALKSLEHYLGLSIRQRLLEAVDRLERLGAKLRLQTGQISNSQDYFTARKQLLNLRRQYSRTETTIDFYADALNTRSNERLACLMSACDALARQSMFDVLSQLRQDTPHVLTYVDKGLGASILKMGLRLWDGGTINPVAAIKVVYHNLLRPTSLIHEAGHQVAHILNWNTELAIHLRQGLARYSLEIAEIWSSWASEIAADAFAFVHTGYAAIASLHDVLSLDSQFVFRFNPGDPHPISFLRVLLGTAMCRITFGMGLWDDMETTWLRRYSIQNVPVELRPILRASLPIITDVATITLQQRASAFQGRSLVDLIDPQQVNPIELLRWEKSIGISLFQSPHWIANHALRLLALSGYKIAITPQQMNYLLRQQEVWMLKLGSKAETIQRKEVS